MKILISLSSPELDIIPFSGTKGCYSAITPDEDSCNIVVNLAKSLGLTTDAQKLHCTVMYSKVAPTTVPQCRSRATYEATISKVEHWSGHDDAGYVVAHLDCPLLHKEHARLRNLGCKPTFDDYTPHMTLFSGIDLDDALSAAIAKANKNLPQDTLRLTNQFIGDLS